MRIKYNAPRCRALMERLTVGRYLPILDVVLSNYPMETIVPLLQQNDISLFNTRIGSDALNLTRRKQNPVIGPHEFGWVPPSQGRTHLQTAPYCHRWCSQQYRYRSKPQFGL